MLIDFLALLVVHPFNLETNNSLLKTSSIQTATFPKVEDPHPSLTATSQYIRSILASIGAADGTQQKCLAKGKHVRYDPKQPKRLTIFVATSWPAWQTRYINLVQEMFDGFSHSHSHSHSLDMKEVAKKLDKAEMKKAMPFIQRLGRRLQSGESKADVFERSLGFDEAAVLRELAPGLTATIPKLEDVDIVLVQERERATGTVGFRVKKDEDEDKEGVEGLPNAAGSAEPGSPSFDFTNL
jgi:leucyl-tRNA synthetase